MDIKKIQPLLQAKGVPISYDDLNINFLSLYEVAFEDMFEGNLDELIEKQSLRRIGTRPLNIKRLQSILLEKGIRIGNDDPIFTTLGLNDFMLENMAETYREKLKREHVQRLSFESVKKEKIVIYAACLIITALAFFGGQKIEWLRQSLIGIGGMAIGAALCLVFFKENSKSDDGENAVKLASNAVQIDVWTATEFHRVAGNMTPNLSQRTKAACLDVLIGGLDIDTVATKYNLGKSQFLIGLGRFNDHKRQMQE